MTKKTETMVTKIDPIYLEKIFTSLPDLYLIIDANFNIVEMSDAYRNATMIKKEDVLGLNIFDVFPENPNDPETQSTKKLTESLNRVLHEKKADTIALIKYDIRKPESEGGGFEERYWSPINSPVMDENGNVKYIIHRVIDVTEFVKMKEAHKKIEDEFHSKTGIMQREIYNRAKEVQEANKTLRTANKKIEEMAKKAEKANKMKSEFLANMSHELRTPLNGIIGFSELIYNERVGSITPEIKEYVGDILTSSQHLLQLINDVLDLSKIESGKMEFFPIEVNLKQLVYDIREVLSSLLQKKQLKCNILVDEKLINSYLDPSKFKQVLYNYISNAIKFSHENGDIDITISTEENNMMKLSVKDYGVGIKKSDIPSLFQEFTQLDSGLSKSYQGTGLGLALTKKIITLQNGRVGVESEPDKGSTFYAILPINQPKPENQTKIDIKKSTISSQISSLLIIEDDENDCNKIISFLDNTKYAIDLARNGTEAIIKAKKQKFDVITLDLILPDLSGWEVLKKIRQEGPNKSTPIIVTTIITEKDSSLGFIVNDYLVKPVSSEQLLSAISRSTDHHSDNKKVILIIDDNINSLKLAKHILSEQNYHVICCSDANEGLITVRQHHIDAIIIDLIMPDMNGFTFIQSIKNIAQFRNIPIIVWTEKDITKTDISSLDNQVHAIVKKGLGSTNLLLSELSQYLNKLNENHV